MVAAYCAQCSLRSSKALGLGVARSEYDDYDHTGRICLSLHFRGDLRYLHTTRSKFDTSCNPAYILTEDSL